MACPLCPLLLTAPGRRRRRGGFDEDPSGWMGPHRSPGRRRRRRWWSWVLLVPSHVPSSRRRGFEVTALPAFSRYVVQSPRRRL